MQRRSLLLKPASLARLGLFVLLVGLSGCESWTPVSQNVPTPDPSRFRRALISEQARLVRFVVSYVRRQEAFRAGKRLNRAAVDRLLEEALRAYEQAYGVEGVVMGYRRAQAALQGSRAGVGLQAWWDSLGLDAEQQAWMARLWEEFRTSHTVEELDERLVRYEREVVEALGEERSGVLLWSAAVLYDVAVLVFGREEWVEDFRAMLRALQGEVRQGSLQQEIRKSYPLMRLVLQRTTCEPYAAPQFGDYWSAAGLTGAVMLGCVTGISSLGPASVIPVETVAACAAYGGAFAGAYMLAAYNEYLKDVKQWCRENYNSCKYVDEYYLICEQYVKDFIQK